MTVGLYIRLIAAAAAVCVLLATLSAVRISCLEQERRAAYRLGFAGTCLFLLYATAFVAGNGPALLLVGCTFILALVLILPWKSKPAELAIPKNRIDERDIMFARNRLHPESERFSAYYCAHPEKLELDNKFRKEPGLLQEGTLFHDAHLFAAAQASFSTVSALHTLLEDPPAEKQVQIDPQRISIFVKQWAGRLGARAVGITRLQDYHLYSHLGRNEPYGQPVERDHAFAIAVTVEMDKLMLDQAPYAPAVMESAQQYLHSGTIAVQLALFIRSLGYPARAHIDGNYRVLCPLVARDAGLGEIGRMGLLITPDLGPRVRLAVVTTDLPLAPDLSPYDESVVDFCQRCKKCAQICPSQAIPYGERGLVAGTKRWQINSEACFTYWCTAGTDCGRCIRICPYSHPDNWLHNLVRSAVRRSSLSRALAIWGDDWLYGKYPAPRPPAGWLDQRTAI